MTIASPVSSASFAGNGVTLNFPLPFKFVATADVAVVLRRADGSETLLAETTDYTLSGAGEPSGGVCVLVSPPLPGQTLVCTRAPRILQETDYQENDAFPAESHEAALDLLTMICQALDERLGRAPLLPVSCGLRRPVLAEPAAGRALVWDQDGRVLGPGPSAADIAQAQGFALDAAAALAAVQAARDAALAAAASMVTPQASEVSFDPAASGLSGTTVQAALDELAGQAVDPSALDQLRTLLLAEALRRAIGDAVDGREFLGNGWIDPLADAGEVTITNGAFVSADGGYLTNAGGDDVAAVFDLTAATFLDERGGITTLTVDTANTSGHFNTAKAARVQAGCRIVIDGVSYPILSIAGDGTGANAVVFSGTLAAGAHSVTGIFGCEADGTALRLGLAPGPIDYTHQLSTGDRSALITVTASSGLLDLAAGNAASNIVDGQTSVTAANVAYFTASLAVAGHTWQFDFDREVCITEFNLYTNSDAANQNGMWKMQVLASGSWIDVTDTFDITAATSSVLTKTVSNTNYSTSYRFLGVSGTVVGSGRTALKEMNFKIGEQVSPSGAAYPAALSVDCTDWTALKALSATETLNSQNLWYALSFDGGTTYSAFVGSAWLPIVRNNSGTWEYWTGSAWAASTINSALGAMAQAAGVAGNQMTGATLAGLSQAQIEGSGGFAGGQTSLPMMAVMYSASASATPVLSALSAQADIQASDAVFEFNAFEATDPDQAKVVLVLQAVDSVTLDTDLTAWVQRGSGDYALVPLGVDSAVDAFRVLVAGDLDQGGSGTATRLKLTCQNHKELRIFAAANCFKSA